MNLGLRYQNSTKKTLTIEQLKNVQFYFDTLEEQISEGKGLFLWGSNGTGKSYIASILCKQVWSDYRVSSYMVTASEVKDSFIKEIPANKDSSELMRDRILSVRFLVLDDVGTEYRTNSGFFETQFEILLRQRIREKLTTLLTSNVNPKDLISIYGESAVSLMKEATYPIKLVGDDWRGKKV